MKPFPSIVVNTSTFRENSGGRIVLHFLVDRLRAMGVQAYAYPIRPPIAAHLPRAAADLQVGLRWAVRRFRFRTHPSLDVPLAPRHLLPHAIAIYPEIVSGNPLGAAMVVRWLLHRPEQFGVGADRSQDDLTFAYGEVVARSLDNAVDGILRLRWLRDDLYRNRNTGPRSGAALLVRKGALDQNHEIRVPPDAIPVDGLSHEEMADVFNRCERLYCCDPYTLLTYYAARCGCLPVIVPPAGMSKQEWHEREEFRLGHAFGDSPDELEFALQTRDALICRIQREKEEEQESLKNFLDIILRTYTEGGTEGHNGPKHLPQGSLPKAVQNSR